MTNTFTRYINTKNLSTLIGLLAFFIIIPHTMNIHMMTVINSALAYYIGALGISLMLGMGGQMSFATITFMGLGAFTTAQFSRNFGMNTVLAIFLSMLIVMAVSGILGLLLFRLSGAYFTFATIGLVQIGANIFTTYRPFTGGPDGISGIPRLVLFGFTFNTLRNIFT